MKQTNLDNNYGAETKLRRKQFHIKNGAYTKIECIQYKYGAKTKCEQRQVGE